MSDRDRNWNNVNIDIYSRRKKERIQLASLSIRALTACQWQDKLCMCCIVLRDELHRAVSCSWLHHCILHSPVSVTISRCNVGSQTNVCGSRLIQLTKISSRMIPSCVYRETNPHSSTTRLLSVRDRDSFAHRQRCCPNETNRRDRNDSGSKQQRTDPGTKTKDEFTLSKISSSSVSLPWDAMTFGEVIWRKKPAEKRWNILPTRPYVHRYFSGNFALDKAKRRTLNGVKSNSSRDSLEEKPRVSFIHPSIRVRLQLKNLAEISQQGVNDVIHRGFIEMIGGDQSIDAQENFPSSLVSDLRCFHAELQLMRVERSNENIVIDIGHCECTETVGWIRSTGQQSTYIWDTFEEYEVYKRHDKQRI